MADIFFTVLLNSAATGGVLWAILNFALKRKLAEMNSNHEASLRKQHANHEAELKRVHALFEAQIAESVHARNATYSRFSEKRAEVVMELHAALQKFSWIYANLTIPPRGEVPARKHFANSVLELSQQSNIVIEIILKTSFYLPEDFRQFVVGRWYSLARKQAEEAAAVGVNCERRFETKEYSNSEQLNIFRAELENLDEARKENREAMKQVNNHISDFLELVFKDSAPLQPIGKSAEGEPQKT